MLASKTYTRVHLNVGKQKDILFDGRSIKVCSCLPGDVVPFQVVPKPVRLSEKPQVVLDRPAVFSFSPRVHGRRSRGPNGIIPGNGPLVTSLALR